LLNDFRLSYFFDKFTETKTQIFSQKNLFSQKDKTLI